MNTFKNVVGKTMLVLFVGICLFTFPAYSYSNKPNTETEFSLTSSFSFESRKNLLNFSTGSSGTIFDERSRGTDPEPPPPPPPPPPPGLTNAN